ncbi:origin recognition complex subunit 3 N-terminus-domain-containing protein [Chytriomyces cf. hyalinus JEL632]|nr:origin recognition complex subunit 3 N-terminus-domain-containing protein [Chytriomyces cf. hyalinus JEL632]
MERTVDVSLLEIPSVQREQETAAKKRRISASASRSVSTALLPSLASANSGSFSAISPHFEPLLSAKEPQKSVKQREMLSTHHIQNMRETAENCLLNLNAKSFSRIEAFVESAHASTNTLSSTLPIKELPVALILGENQSLHDSMASRFLDSKRFYFAVLNPMNASDIKSCFKAIALQVILEQSVVPSDSLEIQSSGAHGMDEDEVQGAKRTKGRKRDGAHVDLDVDAFDQDDENPVVVEDKSFVNHRTRKLAPHDIRALKSWWNAQPNSPAKSMGIVICVPEFERFNVSVFSHFVKVCSASMNEIPFTLLLGISTTLDIVFNACDKSVVRLLRCERFHLSKSDETVDALVSELFLAQHGNVQMTHDVFSQIFNGYWSNHKSIHALLDATQYSIMAHFHANPVSALMQPDLDNVEIYPELLDRMRLLPSFEHHVQQLIEKDCLEEANILLNSRDPTVFLNLVQSARNDLAVHHSGIAFAIRLFMSTRELLKMPMPAGSVYSLYSRMLGSDVDFGKDASAVKGFVGETCVLEVLKRLKAVKPVQLMEIVQSWQDALPSFHYLDHVAENVTAFERHVQQYHTQYKKKLKENDDSDTSDEEHRVQLNERLLPSSARKTRVSQRAGLVGHVKESSWVFFAGLVVDSFEALMRKLTRHHSTLLFNEIYYFGDYKILMKNFQPHPRPIIQTALGTASDYLACKCCKSNGTLHPSSLDMSIVYRLHSECGHLINVHDLFFGFELIVRNESPAPDMSSIQARFATCMTQLEFLGFIKPTMRKTDHVLKMTASFM